MNDDTIFEQVDTEAAHDYAPEGPAHPPRRELDRENLPGDFKVEPSAEDIAANQRLVAAAHPLPPRFRDEAF